MKKRISKMQILRRTIQGVSFLLLPGLFIDAFNGFKAIMQAIVRGKYDLSLLIPQLFPTVLLLFAAFMLGRFFCGYLCAFGTLEDVFYVLGSKVFKLNFKLSEKTDKVLKKIKFILLPGLIITWIFGIKLFATWSPWDVFGMLDSFPPDFAYAFSSFLAGSVIFMLMMMGSMFIERFFCRCFCPLGAMFTLVSRFKIIRIKKPSSACGKCRICTSHCAMGVPLYKEDVVSSGDCIGCMQCVPPCPRKNVSCTVASKDAAPLAATVAAAYIIGLYYVGNIGITTYAASTESKTAVIQSINNAATNGSTSQASGIQQSAQQILDNAIPDSSGSQAEGQNEASAQQPTSTPSQEASMPSPSSQTADKSQQQPSQQPVASQQTQQSALQSSSQATPKPTPQATPSTTPQPTPAPTVNASGYKDGTYEGSGIGYHHRTTTVSVTISNGQITDINTISTGDDGRFYDRAFPYVTSEIISAQDTSVDAVSGATFSSNGIMSAVADALSKAKQ
ncbi:MAG: FMN-binding protein [Clostridia bacterium]|nr:FMN-binding protein [Clostridia bacterium]